MSNSPALAIKLSRAVGLAVWMVMVGSFLRVGDRVCMNASFGRLSNSFLLGLARFLARLLTCLKSRLQRGFDVPDRQVMEVQPVAVACRVQSRQQPRSLTTMVRPHELHPVLV